MFLPRARVSLTLLTLVCLTGCPFSKCRTSTPGPEVTKSEDRSLAQNQLEPLAPRVVAFLGDSLTAGYGLSAFQAFPSKIQRKIDASGLKFKVINAGVSGDTSAGILERVPWVLKSHPSIVFLCAGANDGLRGLSVVDLEKNVGLIIEKLQAARVNVVLAGMLMPANLGPEYTAGFAAVYPRVAWKFDLVFLPFLMDGVALNPELTLPDNVHPNDKGTDIIADHVWQVLQPVLTSLP